MSSRLAQIKMTCQARRVSDDVDIDLMCDAVAVTDDKLQRNPLGPVGRQVKENVKTLRLARGYTHERLAELLREHGRPIPVIGLSRIENGARRVDVDDLNVLAGVLATTPYRLMYPDHDLDPQNPLRAEDYVRHQEEITQVVDTILGIVEAGVDYSAVVSYILNALTLELAKRKGRHPRGER